MECGHIYFRHTALLRLPGQKIGNQGEARGLALFGVKLSAHQIVTSDHGGKDAAIIGVSEDRLGIFRGKTKTMDKIGMGVVR